MLAKLKDMGNQVLGKIGLSTDSFKFGKTEGGGFNITMK